MSANADPQASPVVLLGVDWGTSNLRVHQIDASGAIVDSRHSACGILKVPAKGFASIFEEQAGDWLRERPTVPVVASGMVGARQGWVEVPYVLCPVSIADLARALCPVDLGNGRHMHLVSGAAWRGGGDLADVIRGEESTIVGALRGTLDEGLVCLPGTHTKWAWVADGAVQRFRTAMTGEVYQALLEHSILGRMAMHDAAFDEHAFARGVRRAATTGGLLHHLFSVRALRLFDELSEQQVPSYLSGLLTAADVLSMRSSNELEGALTLVGAGATGNAYAQAFTELDVPFTRLDSDTAVACGLHAISRAAGLI